MKGFGFVQFQTVEEAQSALQMNAQKILGWFMLIDFSGMLRCVTELFSTSLPGRPVAVDWCVPKNKFVLANVASGL